MIDHLGTKYDYGSIMHYSAMAFSKNGQPTIEPVEKNVKIGQRIQFSETDLFKINKLYNCPSRSNG
jgi:astacin